MKPLSATAQRILELLTEAAAAGAPCPRIVDLARAAQRSDVVTGRLFYRLEDRGLITVERFASWRRVTIVATGQRTAMPPEQCAREAREVELIRLVDQGNSLADAAMLMGVPKSTAHRTWQRMRLAGRVPDRSPYYIRHGRKCMVHPYGLAAGVAMMDKAAALAGSRPDELKRPWRDQALVRARWVLALALYRRAWSNRRIGLLIDRDRATVIYAVRQAEYRAARPERFPEFCQWLAAVEAAGKDAEA